MLELKSEWNNLRAVDLLNEIRFVVSFFADAACLFSDMQRYRDDPSLNARGAAVLGMWIDDKIMEVVNKLEEDYSTGEEKEETDERKEREEER